MDPEVIVAPNSSRRTSASSEVAEVAKLESKNADEKKASEKSGGDEQQSNSNQEDNDDDDKEDNDDDDDDHEKVIEKSHNERFLKKNAQILSYKVPGVNAYVSFEIKTGKEVIWNDVICESSETKEARLLTQLKKMRRSYHPNSMRILDCWRIENRISFITERPDETYTTLRHWFNISRLSRNAMTSKRLIRQIVSGLKYISDHSLVHGNISTDSILIYGTNVKLGPFALDAFWHSHTVRKTTKKNYYLSSDWADPAVRITSLTDAYAMGILCLEIVMWCPLDNELGEGDVDVSKYVLDRVELFDDPLLRNFIKVCMSGNRHLGINELFDVSAFFEPPSLRHLCAKVITDSVSNHFSTLQATGTLSSTSSVISKQSAPAKHTADINGAYQQLLRHARSSFEVDSIVAQVNLKGGMTRQLLFKDVNQYYISYKFLEDIDHGYYPSIKFDPNGHAIVPAHVQKIISGDWQKEKEEKEAKEKEEAQEKPPDQKARKESKETGPGASSGVTAADPSSTRPQGTAEKVSPPRTGSSTSSGATASCASAGSASCTASRQPTASPARQQPSKLPVIDSSGVRRSASGTGLAATSGKPGETAKEPAVKEQGASATSSPQGGTGCTGTAPAGAATAGTSAAASTRSGATAGAAKEGKRAASSRSAAAGASQGAAQGGGGSAGAAGGSGASATVVRRSGNKATRGMARTSAGSAVSMLRRRGGSTSPMPQRVRHGVETSGRMTRGGSTTLAVQSRQPSKSITGAENVLEENGRTYGPRNRRNTEGTTREHHRRSLTTSNDTRSQIPPEKTLESCSYDATIGTVDEPSPRKDTSNVNELTSDNPEAEVHSSDEEYEDDYEDYYEDDLEELYEEDEIEYESQFEHRGRRGQEDAGLNIITDVPPPVEKEGGSAYFTDVFFEYLGLGRWLLVVKFHLLRCRDDPRGNPYRELMLQLKDNEWHDVDGLLDRLTHAGVLMRPEERPILRQYLDAARHNRPLRETFVQNALAGPDPTELFQRLLDVQKQRLDRDRDAALEEERAGSQEPSGMSSRHNEGWGHLRSARETPASDGILSGQPHTAACRALVSQMSSECGPKTQSMATATVELASKEVAVGTSEGEVEGDDEGSGKHTFACSCMPGTHAPNPLEPVNKYCPFCDRCDYILVDGPAYLRSPCYHCRVYSAEKEGIRPEQLYRLHTQNRVPWPLFLQKYFNWPPDDIVTDSMALNECKWRSRVVCVCFRDQETWPPCVEFPWLYNPPQGSIAYRMQVEQFSPGTHLEPMNLWCRRQSQRTDILKNIASLTPVFRAGEKFPSTIEQDVTKRTDRDPELQARPNRRARSLTVGSEQSHWSQLFSMSIAMHQAGVTDAEHQDATSLQEGDLRAKALKPEDCNEEGKIPVVSLPTALGAPKAASNKVSFTNVDISNTDGTSQMAVSEMSSEASSVSLSVEKTDPIKAERKQQHQLSDTDRRSAAIRDQTPPRD